MVAKEELIKRLSKLKNDDREYSKTELLTIIGKIYVDVYKEKKLKLPKEPKVKKEPSAYNLFIKEQMKILLEKGIISSNERMKIASNLWNELKEQK